MGDIYSEEAGVIAMYIQNYCAYIPPIGDDWVLGNPLPGERTGVM